MLMLSGADKQISVAVWEMLKVGACLDNVPASLSRV